MDDVDTIGAVYGQVAGAFYALAGIPERWRVQIPHAELITRLADGLHGFAAKSSRGEGRGHQVGAK